MRPGNADNDRVLAGLHRERPDDGFTDLHSHTLLLKKINKWQKFVLQKKLNSKLIIL